MKISSDITTLGIYSVCALLMGIGLTYFAVRAFWRIGRSRQTDVLNTLVDASLQATMSRRTPCCYTHAGQIASSPSAYWPEAWTPEAYHRSTRQASWKRRRKTHEAYAQCGDCGLYVRMYNQDHSRGHALIASKIKNLADALDSAIVTRFDNAVHQAAVALKEEEE